jgi:tagatose 6-phosphate kinase
MITTVTLNASVDKRYVVNELHPQTVMRVLSVQNSAGGKGLNVARVAALLGSAVTATGFLGGHSGKYVEALLRRDKITADFVQVVGETRSCINVLDKSTGASTEFLEPGEAIAEEDAERFLQKYDTLLQASNVISISGSVPPGTPPDFYGELILRACAKDKKVLLDSSGTLLAGSLRAKPAFIKPNRDELQQLLGSCPENPAQIVQAAQKLHTDGIPVVVVSLGAQGAVLCCSSGTYRCASPQVKAVNTVGCGDSMVAAFAAGFDRGEAVPDIFADAVAVAAANACCSQTGCFLENDRKTLKSRIRLEKVQ